MIVIKCNFFKFNFKCTQPQILKLINMLSKNIFNNNSGEHFKSFALCDCYKVNCIHMAFQGRVCLWVWSQ